MINISLRSMKWQDVRLIRTNNCRFSSRKIERIGIHLLTFLSNETLEMQIAADNENGQLLWLLFSHPISAPSKWLPLLVISNLTNQTNLATIEDHKQLLIIHTFKIKHDKSKTRAILSRIPSKRALIWQSPVLFEQSNLSSHFSPSDVHIEKHQG